MCWIHFLNGSPWPVLALVCLMCSVGVEMGYREHDQERLYHDLFVKNSYNKLIRPVIDTNDSLQINFSLSLSAIINVDAMNQVIITNVWLQMYWVDYQLVWNSSKYGGIEQIKVDHTKVWLPDMVLFNNADGNFEVSFSPNCVLQDNGRIYIVPPAIYTSSCSIDVKYFPFDQQNCEMKFGSWTFQGNTLVYGFEKSNKIVLDDYMKSGAWDIIDSEGRIEVINNDTITRERISDGTFKREIVVYLLVLRRKTLFYTVNLIIPCFLHALVCLCVFVLPAGKGKKITLVANVLVSLVVLLLLLQKILPPSRTIPLIAKYFIFTFIMNALEISVAIVIIFAHNRTPRMAAMPRWLGWLFLYKMPKYLLMKRPDHNNRWQPKSCTPPPSYPDTPQAPRATIIVQQVTGGNKRRRAKTRGTRRADLSRDDHRVQDWRQRFNQSHWPGHGGATISSSTSGSCFSTDDSPTFEGRGLEPSAFTGDRHNCCLPDTESSQSDESIGIEEVIQDAAGCVDRTKASPLVLTKEVYSACNAIKFICHQTRNKEDYNMVMDDWKYLAAVVDRLLMIIYVLVSLGGTLGVLLNAPHILGVET